MCSITLLRCRLDELGSFGPPSSELQAALKWMANEDADKAPTSPSELRGAGKSAAAPSEEDLLAGLAPHQLKHSQTNPKMGFFSVGMVCNPWHRLESTYQLSTSVLSAAVPPSGATEMQELCWLRFRTQQALSGHAGQAGMNSNRHGRGRGRGRGGGRGRGRGRGRNERHRGRAQR